MFGYPIKKAYFSGLFLSIFLLSLAVSAAEFDTGDAKFDWGTGVANSWDWNKVTGYSDGSVGLFKDMNTEVFNGENSFGKTRTVSMFSFGANKIEIADASLLSAQDSFDHQLSNGFERFTTISSSDGLPAFGLITEDLVTISDEAFKNEFNPASINTKKTLILPNNYDAVKASKLGNQLSTLESGQFDVRLVNFNNYDEMMLLFGTNWGEWFKLFADPDLWTLLKTQKDSNVDIEDHMNFWDSNGAITCRWGYESDTQVTL